MNKLKNYCRTYFKKDNYIYVFGSDEPGEGEHKIFEFIRNNNHTNQNTLVYGLDADLIMLYLIIYLSIKIFIYLEKHLILLDNLIEIRPK